MTDWGHEIQVSAYFEGKPTEAEVAYAIEEINRIWPEADFVGIKIVPIAKKPLDQIGS